MNGKIMRVAAEEGYELAFAEQSVGTHSFEMQIAFYDKAVR